MELFGFLMLLYHINFPENDFFVSELIYLFFWNIFFVCFEVTIISGGDGGGGGGGGGGDDGAGGSGGGGGGSPSVGLPLPPFLSFSLCSLTLLEGSEFACL